MKILILISVYNERHIIKLIIDKIKKIIFKLTKF